MVDFGLSTVVLLFYFPGSCLGQLLAFCSEHSSRIVN